MHIDISLEYFTAPGERIVLEMGDETVQMNNVMDGVWAAEMDVKAPDGIISYSFSLMKDDRSLRKEWHAHKVHVPNNAKSVQIRDRWMDIPEDLPFWSKAFTDVIFKNRTVKPTENGNVSFSVNFATLESGEQLAITGSGPLFDDWKKFIPFGSEEKPRWTVSLNVAEPFEYKFVILDSKTGEPKVWESGPNHFLAEVPLKGSALVINNLTPAFERRPWRGAGTVIPLFSLRSNDSFGIGEFADIKKLVDWTVATGQNIIQLLPINDTSITGTWTDSYPYNAISSFALHPIYVSLTAAGVKPDAAYRKLQKELNGLQFVDYERVQKEKLRLLRSVFAHNAAATLKTPAYKKFCDSNEYWLKTYAAFCVLRDEFGTSDFHKWKGFSAYSDKKVNEYVSAHAREVEFYCWLQYILDAQLKDAVQYAHKKGIAIKGDIPIGICRTSADTWRFPQFFNMDSQAGAPPDAFSTDGQNWGFPTYNWDEMAKDGYTWWKGRLKKMSEYFDAFRIDHILGFFRIWEIPEGKRSGLDGHFNPALPYTGDEIRAMGLDPNSKLFVPDPHRDGYYHPRISAQETTDDYRNLNDSFKQKYNDLYNDFFYHRNEKLWEASAMKKLTSLLGSTKMLACGEDLGMIPACVPEVMNRLKILSLEVQRMPKKAWEVFGNPASYPYRSVCTTSSHDTSTLRAWWEEDRTLTEKYYHEVLHCEGAAPFFCEPYICEMIIKQHLDSPSMLCILPIQDWTAIDGEVRYQGDPKDERVNVPAESRHYWRWRMNGTIEDLIAQKAFNMHLRDLIKGSRS